MIEKDDNVCQVCKKNCGIVKVREDGRRIGKGCWMGGEMYRSHWFVKSLQYKVDRPVAHRTRKPLPGQQELPFLD